MTDLVVVQRSPIIAVANGPAVPVPHALLHRPGGTDQVTGAKPDSGTSLPVLPSATYPAGTTFCRTTDYTLWVVSTAGTTWQQIGGGGGGDPTMGGDLTGTASNAQIAAGAIVNADVNASAAIAKSKLAALAIADADVAAGAAIAESKLSIATRTPEPYLTDYGIITSGNAVTLNHIRGVRYRWPKSGTVTGLAVYINVSSGNFVVGIYDLAATNLNLLKGSASVAAGTVSTWQGVDLSSGLAVVGGDDAYLVAHTDNSTVAFGRAGALVSNNAQGPFPAGYMSGADGMSLRSWDFNRASYSSPLPNQIATASIASNAPIVFAIKYA